MKVGNRGVVISTVLYGILTIMVLMLLLIFNIMYQNRSLTKSLVSKIEKDLNNCVYEDIELNECYKNGNLKCNHKSYDVCRGNDVSYYELSKVASVGDYVDYDAGIWEESLAIPISKDNRFGGYSSLSSRNNGVSCIDNITSSSGWMILSIDDDIIKLIHRGTPECFYYEYDGISPYLAYNSEMILTGRTEGNINLNEDAKVHDFSYYLNREYADSVTIFTKEELEKISGSLSDKDSLNCSFDEMCEGYYYLASASSSNYLWYVSGNVIRNGNTTLGYDASTGGVKLTLGIRPVITLKKGVLTTGKDNNGVWVLY